MLLAELDLSVEHVRTARLVAGRVAVAAGLDEETADDVRLAVGEVCARLAASPRLLLRFDAQPGELSVWIDGGWQPAPDADAGAPDLGWLIIESVVPQIRIEAASITLAWPLPTP